MKKHFDVIVVIPVGPDTALSFVADTLLSFAFYTKSTYKIIIADDSQQGIGRHLKNLFPKADIFTSLKPMGHLGGLYRILADAFQYALTHYCFKVLLKIDTDALVIHSNPEAEAIALFEASPVTGMAGQYPNQHDGSPCSIEPGARTTNSISPLEFIKRPAGTWWLRKLYKRAKATGYKAEEGIAGGAYFFSYNCLAALSFHRLLPQPQLAGLNLKAEQLFSLLVSTIGFKSVDLSSGNFPLAYAPGGLPAAPDQLYKEGKKIIHSVRFWQDINEEQIRSYFQHIRELSIETQNPTFITNG